MKDKYPSRAHPVYPGARVRLGALAVAACFLSVPAWSNPVNPVVVNGTAGFQQSGNVLTVTNSNGAIINWDKFSIGAGETTHFAQTSASSTVLNRVLANDPTTIYGTLSSNGRVWLVNPAGIMVGAGGRVDVAGFVASTLNISNENFLAGRNLFVNEGSSRDVINRGEIRTPAGGSVYLVGGNVGNEGIIHTPGGETILAAGQTVSLIDSATPGVKVEITGADGNATNLGLITAEAGRIGIAGVVVRNGGTLNASSVVSEGGRVFLRASRDAYVDGAGRIVTNGTRGGQVEVLGDRVAVMDHAEIDASGAMGGGRILIGGDYQGSNPDVPNASVAYFGADAMLKVDATEVGAGGTAIVWADDTTRAYGRISARGAGGGDGGFVETSGRKYLAVDGIRVDTGGGRWLLDPTDITVVHSGTSGGATFYGGVFANGGGATATLTDYDINANLAGNDIVINTSGGVGGAGDILFNGSSGDVIVTNSSGVSRNLTLVADRDVIFLNGTTHFTSSAGSPLAIAFVPGTGRKVEVQAGGGMTLDTPDIAGPVTAFIGGGSGKTWENFGTVTVSGYSAIDLNNPAGPSTSTFNNNTGATLNLNSQQGWAIQSEPINQAEAIINAGIVNVNASTAIEAAYNQTATGTLNIAGGQGLSMQHLGTVSGTVNLGGGQLSLPEQHSGAYSFSNAAINGPGTLQIGKGAGGSMTTVAFNNVTTTGGLKVLREQFGTLNFSGANSFADTRFFANDIANGNIDWNVPVASYSGNVQWWAKGNVSLAGNLTFAGPVTLAAGWDTNIGTPNVTPSNPGNLVISSRQVTGGAITLLAGGDIALQASTAPAAVIGSGPMVVSAGGQLSLFASATGGFKADLNTTGSQTISVGSINMAAGSGGNWAFSRIRADGDQQITTTSGGISIGGGGGSFYGGFAMIEHGAGGGNQSVSINSGGLFLVGGSATGTTVNPADVTLLVPASCSGDPSCLAQPVTGALAFVSNRSGSQTVDFQSPASLTISGGSGGIRNAASISQSGGGLQTISGAPTVILAGGSNGGNGYKTADGFHYLRNSATIFAPGAAQVLDFNTLTVSSTGTSAAGFGGAAIVGNGQTIDVAGALALTAGNTNAGGGAVVIQSSAGQAIHAGGVTITGGGVGYDNTAAIRQNGSGAVGQNLNFVSLSITGGSGTGTAGDTGDCGVACAGHAASNHAGVYNAGSLGQTLTLGAGGLTMVGGTGGNRNLTYIQNRSSGLQTITTASLSMQGGDSGGENSSWLFGQSNAWGGSWLANSASITSGWSGGIIGAQTISSAGSIMIKGNSGAGTGGMGGAGIASTGTQSISGGAVSLIGGAGGGSYESMARIVSLGTQTLSVGSLVLNAGTTGNGNRASLVGSGQSITVSGGVLTVAGGGSTGADASNTAEIFNQGGAGQSILLSAPTTMTIAGGAGSGFNPTAGTECGAPCYNLSSWNAAQVRNESGAQTITFQSGGTLAISGGSNGNDNSASLRNRSAGAQQILGNPAIVLTRGNSGGTQVWAPSLVEHPGTSRWQEMTNDAGIEADGVQTINASSITLNAGTGSAVGGVFITGHTQNITVTGALSMTGGTESVGAPIGAATEFQFIAPAVIGNDGAGHSLNLTVGSLATSGGGYGPYGGSPVLIGTYKSATNTTISSYGGILLGAGSAGAVQIGSFFGNGGSLSMASGVGGIALNQAFVGTGVSGNVTLATANGPLSQASGGKLLAHDVSIATGTGDVTQAAGAVIGAYSLAASGNNLSFLGDNQTTGVTLASTGPGGGIAFNTAADVHVASATADTGNIVITTTSLPAASVALGTVAALAGDVSITAEKAILDDNGAALNILAQNIALTSNGGGMSGGLAISADTSTVGALTASVSGGSYGGISIRNAGVTSPASISISDLAAAENTVSFKHAGSDLVLTVAHSFEVANGGDLAIFSDGNMTLNGGPYIYVPDPASRILFGALGTMSFLGGSYMLPNNDLGIAAANVEINGDIYAKNIGVAASALTIGNLTGSGGLHAANRFIGMVTGDTTITGGYIRTSGADLELLVGGNLTIGDLSHGGEIWGGYLQMSAPFADVSIAVGKDMRLNNGAHIRAANDVYIDLLGPTSTLYLNDGPGYANPSYVLSDIGTMVAATTHLDFLKRESGGILIDGVETTATVVGGSGFYVLDTSTPALPGAGLEIVHAGQADNTIAAQLVNAIVKAVKDADTTTTPTDPGVVVPGGKGGGDAQAGGEGGSFGSGEEGGKDEKDEKDKQKSDQTKDGKKDEKPSQKKLAQCT